MRHLIHMNLSSRPPAGIGLVRLVGGALLALGLLAHGPVHGAVLVTQEEALALAFPGAVVERRTAYLDEAQIAQWGIEEEFLKLVVKSSRECKRIVIDPSIRSQL